jgi:hypothetical protein
MATDIIFEQTAEFLQGEDGTYVLAATPLFGGGFTWHVQVFNDDHWWRDYGSADTLHEAEMSARASYHLYAGRGMVSLPFDAEMI